MGVYTYSVRSKNLPLVLEDGSTVPCHHFEFLATRGMCCRRYVRLKQLCDRADSFWAARKGGVPEYVVLCDGTVKDGDPVFKWNDRTVAWDEDTPNFERACIIGWARLTKLGRRKALQLVKLTSTVTFGAFRSGVFHVEGDETYPGDEIAAFKRCIELHNEGTDARLDTTKIAIDGKPQFSTCRTWRSEEDTCHVQPENPTIY